MEAEQEISRRYRPGVRLRASSLSIFSKIRPCTREIFARREDSETRITSFETRIEVGILAKARKNDCVAARKAMSYSGAFKPIVDVDGSPTHHLTDTVVQDVLCHGRLREQK